MLAWGAVERPGIGGFSGRFRMSDRSCLSGTGGPGGPWRTLAGPGGPWRPARRSRIRHARVVGARRSARSAGSERGPGVDETARSGPVSRKSWIRPFHARRRDRIVGLARRGPERMTIGSVATSVAPLALAAVLTRSSGGRRFLRAFRCPPQAQGRTAASASRSACRRPGAGHRTVGRGGER